MSFVRTAICILLLSVVAFAQAPTSATPASTKAEQPLKALPYTPSLDVPSMDKTVDPCVDFYQYSCGGWRKNNPTPGDQAAWSVYGKLHEDNQRFSGAYCRNFPQRRTAARRPN